MGGGESLRKGQEDKHNYTVTISTNSQHHLKLGSGAKQGRCLKHTDSEQAGIPPVSLPKLSPHPELKLFLFISFQSKPKMFYHRHLLSLEGLKS